MGNPKKTDRRHVASEMWKQIKRQYKNTDRKKGLSGIVIDRLIGPINASLR